MQQQIERVAAARSERQAHIVAVDVHVLRASRHTGSERMRTLQRLGHTYTHIKYPCTNWHADIHGHDSTAQPSTHTCSTGRNSCRTTGTPTCMSGSGSSHDCVYRNVGGNSAGLSTRFSCGASAHAGNQEGHQ
eukprot:213604-Chlamydomonas_euryale.AAC.28